MKTTKNVYVLIMGVACLLNFFTGCKKQEANAATENNLVADSKKSANSVSSVTAPSLHANFSDALSQCKLQSSYENSGTTTTNSNTNGLVKPDYFFLNNSNKMVMISSVGASERTELRHEADITLNTSHRMRFDAVLEDVPNGSGVTIAQVHNDYSAVGKPLIRIYATGGTITSKMSNTYVKADNLYTNGSGSVSFSNGQRIYVRLQFQTSAKKIAVYVENKDNGQIYSQTYTVPAAWDSANGNYYFKTGVYNQGNDKQAKLSYNYLYIDQP